MTKVLFVCLGKYLPLADGSVYIPPNDKRGGLRRTVCGGFGGNER